MKQSRRVVVAAVALAVLTAPEATAAQAPVDNPLMAGAARQHAVITKNVRAAAVLISEADLAFRPAPEVRSFGEILGHIANTQFGSCATALHEVAPTVEDFEERTRKDAILEALDESFAFCARAFTLPDSVVLQPLPGGTTPRMNILIHNIAHTHLHYGNLVTYLRLRGLVPPSSG